MKKQEMKFLDLSFSGLSEANLRKFTSLQKLNLANNCFRTLKGTTLHTLKQGNILRFNTISCRYQHAAVN